MPWTGKGKSGKRSESMSSTLRCFQVLDLLAREPFEIGLSDISVTLQLPLATAHRLTITLCEAGFVEQVPETRRYRLAGKALWTGAGYLRRSEVYRAAFLVLQETAAQCRGLLHLAVMDRDWVLYLHTVGSPSTLYLYADTGERRYPHCTGLGKALLAFQPQEVIGRVASGKLVRFTPKTITSGIALRDELKRIRQRGYAVDDEEGTPGLRCIAAPILDRNGIAAAAFSMSAPTSVLTDDAIGQYVPVIRQAALKVSAQMGYRSSASHAQFLIE